jgi:hypothetical protein
MSDPNAGQNQQPAEAYAQVDQGQRASIAQAFIDHFKGQSDPKSQQLAQVDPATATPAQVADMHDHAAQNHPGILGEVMKHPVVTAALAGFAAVEIGKHVAGR